MINSRNLNDLLAPVKKRAEKFVSLCLGKGIDVIVTSTYRDSESQAALYAQGRTAPGRIVTNARPGDSYHNWRCAFDVVPLRNGKAVWDEADPLWDQIGAVGLACDLDWAGNWHTFREFPHFQYTGGLTLADLKAGKLPV